MNQSSRGTKTNHSFKFFLLALVTLTTTTTTIVSSFSILTTRAAVFYSRRFAFHSSSRIYQNLSTSTSTSTSNSTSTSTSTTLQMSSSTNEDNSNPLPSFGFHNPIILGSGSFTRKLILREMNIPFHLMVRSIDEKALGDRTDGSNPSALVSLLAKAKADHLVQGIMDMNYSNSNNDNNNENGDEGLILPKSTSQETDEGWIVLTADQVVTHDNSILEKPTSMEEAQTMVKGYANVAPATVGACVLTHVPSMIQVAGVDTATIHFLPSVASVSYPNDNENENENKTLDLVEKLAQMGEPVMWCAGGLMVEHPLTKEHIERIDGTEDSVMGLSKDLVLRLLGELKDKLVEAKTK